MDTVYIGGAHRPFNLSADALDVIEHLYGLTPIDGSLFRVNQIKAMRDIVYVALRECDNTIQPDDIGRWLTFANVPTVLSTILETLVQPGRRPVPKMLRNKDLNKTLSVPDYAVRVAFDVLQLTAQDSLLHLGASNASAISIAAQEYGVESIIGTEREFSKYTSLARSVNQLYRQRKILRHRLHMCNAADIPRVDLMRASSIFINLTQDGVHAVEDMLNTESGPFTKIVLVNTAFRSNSPATTVRAECYGDRSVILRTYVVNTKRAVPRKSAYSEAHASGQPIPAPEPERTQSEPVPTQDEPVYSGNQPIPNETIFGDGGSLLMTDPPEAGKEK